MVQLSEVHKGQWKKSTAQHFADLPYCYHCQARVGGVKLSNYTPLSPPQYLPIMPYAVVIWKRGTNTVDICGLKGDDLVYLEKIPCLSARLDVDSEGFIRFGPSPNTKHFCVKPAVVLTGLEVLGFKVVTTTATATTLSSNNKSISTTEYSWTLRREFAEPEPQD